MKEQLVLTEQEIKEAILDYVFKQKQKARKPSDIQIIQNTPAALPGCLERTFILATVSMD